MGNIADYLDWRGDLSFRQDEFNEVDNLILSVICYNDFGGIVPAPGEEGYIFLKDAAKRFKHEKDISLIEDLPFLNEIPGFLEKAAATKRFGNLKLSSYADQLDQDRAKQFSAMVFTVRDEFHFIAFRGTDDSLAGWKEDLQMSFKEEVQSQKEAVKYTTHVMENYTGEFCMGGHSKGGNLAVYAASMMDGAYKASIIEVFNNDGPGFQHSFITSDGYQEMLDGIVTFLPESSIVGMLLEHLGEYYVVKSSGHGLYQHNPFLWEVLGSEFVYKPGLSDESIRTNDTIKTWLFQLPKDERERFVNLMFEVLQSTGATTFGELNKEKLVAAEAMIKAFKDLDRTAQDHLKSTLQLLFTEGHKTLLKSITEDIGDFVKKRISKRISAFEKEDT